MNKKAKPDEPVEAATDEKLDSKPPEDASLIDRIMWVRDRVGTLGKDSQVQAGQGSYKAISHDKVTRYLRPKCVQAGIFTYITCTSATDEDTGAVTQKGRRIVQHRASFDVFFINASKPDDRIVVNQWAYADDYGDKAPGKAASYAMKYALLKMFMVETGEEDEERVEADGGREAVLADDEKMLLDLWAVADEAYGDGEVAAERLQAMSERRFHVENYGKIPQIRFADAVRSIRQDAKLMKKKAAERGGDE